jgi:hypothetical protein
MLEQGLSSFLFLACLLLPFWFIDGEVDGIVDACDSDLKQKNDCPWVKGDRGSFKIGK